MRYTVVKEYDPEGFKVFWARYPRHAAKLDAYKAWCQKQPSAEVQEQILVALSWQTQQPNWLQGDEWIPLPATYLRGERWTDERRATPRKGVGYRAPVPSHEPL